MKNFEVYEYGTTNKLGELLNIETTNEGVKVWYLTLSGEVRSSFLEKVFILS